MREEVCSSQQYSVNYRWCLLAIKGRWSTIHDRRLVLG
jgi:hypothetical protein